MESCRNMVRSLAGIVPGATSVDEFAARASLGKTAAAEAAGWLGMMGVGTVSGESCLYSPGDRMRAAMLLLERGCPVEEVASALHWRDFEGLAAEILESEGFGVRRNHILTRPRAEIDVVGTKADVAMLVDCKHWRRTPASAICGAASRQVARAERYAALHQVRCVPVLVTLHQSQRFARGVPVVPVSQFRSFLGHFADMEGVVLITPAG